MKLMARKGNRDIVGRAGIKNMEDNPLPLFYSYRLSIIESLIVKRSRPVHDFKPVIRRRTFPDVLHADELWLPVMHCDENLLIIATSIGLRLDIEEPVLT
jgi:hypothetical protein